MIRDRGNIKWRGLMLPEHVKALIDYANSIYKIKKPILSEDQLNEIDRCIKIALEECTLIELSVFDDGYIHKVKGYIQKIDSFRRKVYIRTNDETKIISFEKIIGAHLV
jgi:hypothetical protein